MLNTNRRTTLKLLGGAALAAPGFASLSRPTAAQQDLYIGSRYQNFKRGTIHSLDPKTRGFVIIWEDLGRVKLKAADLVANYSPGAMKEWPRARASKACRARRSVSGCGKWTACAPRSVPTSSI